MPEKAYANYSLIHYPVKPSSNKPQQSPSGSPGSFPFDLQKAIELEDNKQDGSLIIGIESSKRLVQM